MGKCALGREVPVTRPRGVKAEVSLHAKDSNRTVATVLLLISSDVQGWKGCFETTLLLDMRLDGFTSTIMPWESLEMAGEMVMGLHPGGPRSTPATLGESDRLVEIALRKGLLTKQEIKEKYVFHP